MTFYFIRQVAFGAHFQNAISCMIWSIVVFPIMTWILTLIFIPIEVIWGVGILAVFFILIQMPIGTTKHPIVNKQHQQYLQKKKYIRVLIVGAVLLFATASTQLYIVYGLVIQSSSMIIQLIQGGTKL